MKLTGIFNGAIYSTNAAALLLGAAGLLSRVLGIFRDRLLADRFGAGRELDLYYAAFQIPDFMVVIFLLGAGSAAILPIFQEYLARDHEEARKLISDLFSIFLWGSILAALIAFLAAPFLIHLIAPGFSQEEQALTVTLTRIMLISPILFGLSNIFSTVVQSFQRFLAYAAAPVLYNLGIIFGILVFVPIWGVRGLALGVILGALLHFGLQLAVTHNLGFGPRLMRPGFNEGVKKVFRISFPRVLSVSLSRLTMIVLVALGSTFEEGSIAVFQLAQNLYFMPIGIFGVSYAVAIFPRLSRAYVEGKAREFFQDFMLGTRAILFWIVPATVLFIVLRAHIVRVAFGSGAFSWEDTRLTAAVLAILAISMSAEALITFLMKGFYALENTWIPFFVNIGASFLSIFLAILFSEALASPSSFTSFVTAVLRISDIGDSRVAGLALGFSIGSLLNVVLLYGAMLWLFRRTFGENHRVPLAGIGKIILASLLAGGAAYAVRVSFAETLPLITFAAVLLQGFIAGAIGISVYFGTLFILKEEEVFSLWRTLRAHLFKVGILPQSWEGETPIH